MAFHPNSTFNLQCASSAYISRQCTGSPLKHLLFIALHLIENDSISFFLIPFGGFSFVRLHATSQRQKMYVKVIELAGLCACIETMKT